MRLTEQLRLAWHTMGWRRRYLPVIAAALGSICLFIGAGIWQEVRAEKAEPCEVTASPAGGINTSISSDSLGQVNQIENILSVSLAWTFSSALQYEDYSSDIRLCGVDSAYLSGQWLQGNAYPDESAMPYLVLNEAAVLALRNEKNVPPENVLDIDWSTRQVFLAGERETAARICGVLQDGNEEPRAYISQNIIKQMRLESGMESPADTLWLRLKDSGVRSQVISDLASLGLQVASGDTREADWNARTERSNLYIGLGIVLFICSSLMIAYLEKLWKKEEENAHYVMTQMGIPREKLMTIYVMRWLLTLGVSIISGGLIIYFIS